MKAERIYFQKAYLQNRYVLEMNIYKVSRSEKYRAGVKYRIILKDLRTGKSVLMDNHHPKGPHIHLDDQQIDYQYSSNEKLIEDFKILVLENMGVKI